MSGRKRLEIVKGGNNQKHIRIVSANNKIVATTEQYKTKRGIENSIKALKQIIPNAKVVDKTQK